uniref:Ubiquitin carboxyl-terminal hydrolase n=1 Tax=Meloidogyne incognita TaxID=6306 RepID=A0A914LGQ4_MELIC
MNKKPLKYKSYDELKSSSQLDPKVIYQLKRFDTNKCYNHFDSIENQARLAEREGDDERSFICYQRALELYQLIFDKKDERFMNGKNGRDFYHKAKDMFTSIELLTENLRLRYDALLAVEKNKNNFREEPDFNDSQQDFVELYIKPTSLLNYVEKNAASILILDYRENKNQIIKCDLTIGEINVVQLEPSTIVLGSLLHCITKTLDISVRPYMEKISQFDLVILLGDPDDITNLNGTKTKILYQALTTYNRTNRLKHPPLILEDGFRGWELSYPCYTISTKYVPVFEKTFDEQFSVWMEESKRVNRLNITYPNLSKLFDVKKTDFNDESELPSSTKFKTSLSFADKLSSKRVFNDEERRTDNAIKAQFSLDSRPETPSTNKKMPLIDRSKKPALPTMPTDSMENDNKSVVDDRSIRDKENLDLGRINNKRFAHPQVLGGARIASAGPSVAATVVPVHPTQPIPVQQPSRPTTPDRSTKKGILQQSQQIEPSAYFSNVYNFSLARIIEDSAYKRMKIKPGHTGLVNMGNTCFMNATLQALFHTPIFSQLFRGHCVANFINTKNSLGTKGFISGCFSALIDIAWSGEYSSIRPFIFLDVFAKRVNSTLADRQQHDAQEFQIYLLDALHEDTNRVDKRRPFEQNYDGSNLMASAEDYIKQSRHFSSSPVNDIFNLLTVSVLQCKSCSTRSACFEGLNQISVELPHNNLESGRIFRLKECLNTHFSTTTLDTPWDCPCCKSKQTATRTTKIWSLPKILIIHLKRFSFNSGRFVKNEVDVHFDIENFDLAPYTHSKSTFLQNKEYNLFAVTNHTGTLNSGHYTSNVKNLQNENEWLHFDDENCTRIRNISSIVTKHAFLLYYVLGDSDDGKNVLL